MRGRARCLTAALLLIAAAASAAPPDLASMHWRSIGPFRGGRVLTVAGVSDDRLHFLFGGVNGGVWETRDAGRTWAPIFDSVGVQSVGALAVAPSNPKVIYVGTGEADMRSDIAQGEGLFRSDDGGRSWRGIGLADSQQIGKILVDPRDPNTVLVAALGHPYAANPERGVFRSTDGGGAWARTLFRDADTGAIDLAFKPGDPGVVYAALWATRRPPWNVYPPSNGPGSGIFRSRDGGRTWTPLTSPALPDHPGRIGLAVAPATPNVLFALIDAKPGGLFRSDDEGASWRKVSGDKRIWERGWYFSGVTVNPANSDELWVCDTIVLHSTDGGRTFTPQKGDPTGDDYHQLWIDPRDPNRRVLGSDQGAQVTLNGGATWSSWYNQPTGQFYHVSTDDRFPYRVYGSQQDSGAASVASRTDEVWNGINIGHFREQTAGGESDEIAPDPDDPDLIFGGRVDRLDLRTGQTRSVDPTLAHPAPLNDPDRATWTLPLTFSSVDHALYFANQRIFRTVDRGERWTPISPDLTRENPGAPATLDPATLADDEHKGPRKGVVYAIAPSPRDARDLWAGTDDGRLWRSRDGGGSWSDITPAGLTPWSKIGAIEPSRFDPQRAYVAIDRHRLDDPAPHILRTRDGGRSWTPIVEGLAVGGRRNSVNVVREDKIRPGLLFAGTERGAFVSLDDGGRWAPLAAALPSTSVRDIDVHGDDLVIATHGRGFYILDDIEPLRELAAGAPTGTHLFTPARAVRFRLSGFAGTPLPKDEPIAANPPPGAPVDYRLASAARVVEIAVLDGGGAVVRRYSSADPAIPPDLSKLPTAPEWLPVAQRPDRAAGLHRLVWDGRCNSPPALHDAERGGGGVFAPPGRYRVRLSVDGKLFEAPLTLLPDPRVGAPPAAYQAQFQLARAIEADRLRLAAALKDFDDPDKAPPALAALAERLRGLAVAVDGADGAPTPDAVTGFAKAHAEVARLFP